MFGGLKNFVSEHWKGAVIALVSLVVGIVATDFSNFRSANREIVGKQIEASAKADHDMNIILQKFADKAVGKSTTTPEDMTKLKSSVQDSFEAAGRLKNHIPDVQHEADAFADALIALQKSAERLTGPIDGKAFKEAVSNYYVAKGNLDKRVNAAQTRWLPTWLG